MPAPKKQDWIKKKEKSGNDTVGAFHKQNISKTIIQ